MAPKQIVFLVHIGKLKNIESVTIITMAMKYTSAYLCLFLRLLSSSIIP